MCANAPVLDDAINRDRVSITKLNIIFQSFFSYQRFWICSRQHFSNEQRNLKKYHRTSSIRTWSLLPLLLCVVHLIFVSISYPKLICIHWYLAFIYFDCYPPGKLDPADFGGWLLESFIIMMMPWHGTTFLITGPLWRTPTVSSGFLHKGPVMQTYFFVSLHKLLDIFGK